MMTSRHHRSAAYLDYSENGAQANSNDEQKQENAMETWVSFGIKY